MHISDNLSDELSLEPLLLLSSLRTLLVEASVIRDLSPISGCTQLTEVILDQVQSKSFTPVFKASHLQQLCLSHSGQSRAHPMGAGVEGLAHFSRLTHLRVVLPCMLSWPAIVAHIGACLALEHLNLQWPYSVLGHSPAAQNLMNTRPNLPDLDGYQSAHLGVLNSCTRLRCLELINCWFCEDLPCQSAMKQLTSLTLVDCIGLSSLQPLGACTQLQRLNLRKCRRLGDLSPLQTLPRLEMLGVGGWRISSIADLHGCKQLRVLVLLKSAADAKDMSDLKLALPHVQILAEDE